MTDRTGNWMQTAHGHAFWPCDPRPEEIFIEDIAHALSLLCRFGGHCREFYCVAQHSVLVAICIEEAKGTREEILWGLLHDAAEAYIGDMVWPLKQSPKLYGYKEVEREVEVAICDRFGLTPVQPAIVKHFDLVMLATEKRDLMNRKDRTGGAKLEAAAARDKLGAWHCDEVEPRGVEIFPWSPEKARREFLKMFHELQGGAGV